MAWSGSGVFTSTIRDILDQTTAIDLNTSTFNLALYNNSVTPDFDATSANTAYGAGTWTGNEVTGTNWSAGGVALSTPTLTGASPAAGQLKWDAVDVSESNTTIAAAFYGCLIYDATVSTPVNDQGLVAVYFGGTGYTTSSGTVSITWDTNGIFYIDLVP